MLKPYSMPSLCFKPSVSFIVFIAIHCLHCHSVPSTSFSAEGRTMCFASLLLSISRLLRLFVLFYCFHFMDFWSEKIVLFLKSFYINVFTYISVHTKETKNSNIFSWLPMMVCISISWWWQAKVCLNIFIDVVYLIKSPWAQYLSSEIAMDYNNIT